MRVAALDLGTNTFLCLIADVVDGKVTSVLDDRTWLVRLGQDVHRTRQFHPEALERAARALGEAETLIAKHQVEKILAVATSAARDVKNGQALLDLCQAHGIPVQIIAGQLEAELTFAGGVEGTVQSNGLAVIDVGGGSTEIILKVDNDLFSKSVDVGSVRITETFFKNYPIQKVELDRASEFIENQIRSNVTFAVDQLKGVIAVGGTPTTIAAIHLGIPFDAAKIQSQILSIEDLETWAHALAGMTPKAITQKFGVDEKRADVLAAGALILMHALKALGAAYLRVSTKGVRFGLATAMERQLLC